MQLPAKLAGVGDAQRPQRHPRHLDLLGGQPGKGVAAKVGVGLLAEHVARLGPGEDQDAEVVGHVGNRDGFAVLTALAQKVQVAQLGDSRREQVIVPFAQAGHGHLAFDASGLGQHVGQRNAAVALWHAVGEQPVEHGLRVGAAYLVLGEAGEIEHADPLAHGAALLGDLRECVAAAEAVFLVAAAAAEPLGPLPAEDLRINRALVLQLAVERRGALRTARIAELAGIVDLVHLLVLVDRLLEGVAAQRPVAVAARIEPVDVDVRLAVHHPLGQVLARAGPLGDADAGAAAHPVIPQARRRAEQEVAVRQVGDRPIDHALDARRLEAGDSVHGVLEAGRDPVQVGRQELHVEAPVDAVQAPGLGVLHLVGPDQDALLFLAVVAGGDRVADHWRLPVEGLDLREVLGHQVLVAHVDHRHAEPDPGRDLVGEGTGGVHHVLADDGALLGDDFPLARGALLGIQHPIAERDRGPAHARALGHGVGGAGRVGVAVVRRVGAGNDALGIEQRMELPDFIGPDQMYLDVQVLQLALDVLEPVHLVRTGCQADGAAAVPAGRLSGLLFQGFVEPDTMVVERGHGETADEVGNQPCRVPGRPGGKLPFFHQHDVGPALFGQVIQQAGTHGPAADHHHTRLSLHF